MYDDIMLLPKCFQGGSLIEFIDDLCNSCEPLLVRVVGESHALTGIHQNVDSGIFNDCFLGHSLQIEEVEEYPK